MSDEQFDALERYVRIIGDLMGLRDWTITISRVPAIPGARAQMDTVDGRKIATLWFAYDFPDHDPEMQRHAVVHELVHVHFDPSWKYVENHAGHIYTPFKTFGEYGIDGIADIIAPFMPMPEWPTQETIDAAVP